MTCPPELARACMCVVLCAWVGGGAKGFHCSMWRCWVKEGMSKADVFFVIEIWPGSLVFQKVKYHQGLHRATANYSLQFSPFLSSVSLNGLAPLKSSQYSIQKVFHLHQPDFLLVCHGCSAFDYQDQNLKFCYFFFCAWCYGCVAINYCWGIDHLSLKLVQSPGAQEQF